MATEQVMQWINRDVRLSKVIHSFETDFSNGYLFGEILCQFGVYEDVTIFSKKTNKEAKVNNFYLIEDALRMLKVRFDGKMTHNIMQEERGAALRLLYQLKLAIQKREGPPPDALEAETMTGLKQSTVNRKFHQNFDQTNAMASSIKPRTVGGKDIRTNKQRVQDAHLIRFDVAQKKLFDSALDQADNERALVQTIQQNQRAENRQKLRENQEFMKEWEEEGRQNWRANRKTRFDNIARQKYFEDREVNLYKDKLNRELNEATAEMRNGCNEFEKNLQKLGIEQNINMDDAIKRMEEKQGIPPGQIQNFSFPATMNKIKETKKQSDFAGKERERRRRKLAVDQANTQERLDKQKQEDMLVQKLLQQQQEEQNNAYADERLRRCKQMLTEQRKAQAHQVQNKREIKYKEMEEQSKLEAKTREAERKVQIERQSKEYEEIRRDQKKLKRRVNIEIASGIVDLIMDMSEEVFDVTRDQRGNKMTKAQWREFSGLFADGRKCSLRNIKKAIVDTDQAQKTDEDGAIQIPPNLSAVALLNQFSKEPALHDLYQFISNSGSFNLDQLKGDLIVHWGDQLRVEKFLQHGGGHLVQNEALGKIIEGIYNQQGQTMVGGMRGTEMRIQDQENEEIKEAADEGDEEAFVSQIPSHLPIKVAILGRAFAGKKTIGAQLVAKYGDQNLKLFNMNDIIKEALDYITPKKVDEAALAAAAKSKKGKQEEVVPVDIFEGKHPGEYKKLAMEMKTKFFENYEGDNLPQKVDLPNLVFDDQLLVNLFIERLKLEYEGQKISVPDEDLEAGIRREKEIVEQLESLDDSAAQVEAPAKKGGKAAAKAGGKTQEETLREELETIRALEPKGWILLDFPRNLTQTKLLETSLSGYESKVDLPKLETQQMFEVWSKVATPPCLVAEEFKGAFNAVASGLDGVLILETPEEECTRRARSRKIDPQTQTVYDMDVNPPEDAKVNDRLQEHNDEAGDPERLQKISSGFSQSIRAIKQWLTRFGLSTSAGDCQVQLDMEVTVAPQPPAEEGQEPANPWREKQTVLQAALEHVERIKEFRQDQFQLKRSKLGLEMMERERRAAEEEARLQQEEEEKKAQELAKSAQDSAEEQKDEEQKDEEGKQAAGVEVVDQDEEELPEAMKTISSSKQLLSEHLHSVGGTSKSIGRSTKFQQRIQEITGKQKLSKWEEMLAEYFREGMQEFNTMRNLRQRVCRSLNETQQKFIDYLGRRSEQQRKINEYCENYNRFSREFPDLIGNPETKKELQNRITILSKQLWENIKNRKDEAMKERLSYMEGGWVQLEMIKLCTSIAKLIEQEFRRFSTISAVVTGHVINEEVDLQDVAKRLTERGTEPYIENQEDRSQVGNSPMLLEVAQTILTKVEALFNEQFVLSLDQKILSVLHTERSNFSMRLNLLFTWATLILHEISSQAFQVFDILDDWVVVAVKRENSACQAAVSEITERVEEAEMHMKTVILPDQSLENHIERIEFFDGPPQYMVDARPVYTVEQSRFSVESLELIYRQLRLYQEDTDLIDTHTFQTLMLLNMQQGVLPNVWRYVPFDAVIELAIRLDAKPLSDSSDDHTQVRLFRRKSTADGSDEVRHFLNWRRAFLILVLMAGKIPTNAEKQAYFAKLRQQQADADSSTISKADFVKIHAWFDKCEGATIVPTQANLSLSPSQNTYGVASHSQQMQSPTGGEAGTSEKKLAALDESVDEEDDDEAGDQERLATVKALIFDTYRIQNRMSLQLEEYINDLEFVFSESRQDDPDERTLYHTVFGMPQ